MKEFSVYSYDNPRLCLIDYLTYRQKQDSSFSIRRWSAEMGLKSHSLLAMLMQGKRQIRESHFQFLADGMNLTEDGRLYFGGIINYANAMSFEEKKLIALSLGELSQAEGFTIKEVEQYEVISNWVHMAILAMTDTKDFMGTEQEVKARLGDKVTLSEIRSAMIRLFDLKLIEWSEDGRLEATANRITSKNDEVNKGVRKYHKQVMDLAKDAIEEVPFEEREFQAFSMAICGDKVPVAKNMIRNFRKKLSQAVSGNGDHVYQTNIQFFPLTKPESDIKGTLQ
jgi:uncharacterized protein (TIGR02147 family)